MTDSASLSNNPGAAAKENLQALLGNKIEQVVAGHLEDYPPEVRLQIGQAIVEDVQNRVIQQLHRGEIDENFIHQSLEGIVRIPSFNAAITNKKSFADGLTNSLSSVNEQKDNILTNYKTLTDFQAKTALSYQQILRRLTESGLSHFEANKVIDFLEQIRPGATTYEFEERLKGALDKDGKKITDPEALALEFAPGAQNYLRFKAKDRPPKIPSKVYFLTDKLGLERTEENLRAVQYYGWGYSAQKVEELSQSHGPEKKEELERVAARMKKLEERPLPKQEFFDRLLTPSAEKRLEKSHQQARQKAEKLRLKQEKRERWQRNKETKWYGWALAPRRRADKFLSRSASYRRFKGFAPKLTPGYWTSKATAKIRQKISQSFIGRAGRAWKKKVFFLKHDHPIGWLLAPKMRLKKAVGNWLLKKALKHGFSKEALAKIAGLASGVGTAITIGAIALSLLSNKKVRQFLFNAVGAVIYGIKYLFANFPLTATLGSFGFMTLGPPGALLFGGIGFGLDKLVGGAKGLFESAGAALSKAAPLLEHGAFLPLTTVVLPFSPLAFLTIAVGPIAAVAVGAIFVFTTISSAFFVQPGDTAGTMGGGGTGFGGPDIPESQETRTGSVNLANQIIDVLLNNCPPLEKVNFEGYPYAPVTKDNWQTAQDCLEKAGLSSSDIPILEYLNPQKFPAYTPEHLKGTGIQVQDNLQCVHFAVIASQGKLSYEGSASNYCGDKYEKQRRTDWENLQKADFVVSEKGWGGHIALVEYVDGAVVGVLETIGTFGGVGRRKTTPDSLKENYCGYLRM